MPQVHKAKVLFIDDEPVSVDQFIAHLRQEGFTNTVLMTSVHSFAEVIQQEPDLIFLDIAGVATSISPTDEGLSLLRYLRKSAPWIRLVVLSGSTFPADRAPDLVLADKCRTKASLSLADITNLVEDETALALSPEYRNVRVLALINEQLDTFKIGWWNRRKLDKAIRAAIEHAGDSTFPWQANVETIRKVLGVIADLAPLLNLLVTGT